jgi:excisionase family DNA binding protein
MPRLLAIKQATYELGISRTNLYELIASGKLKTVKIGRRRFVTVEAIDEFIASLSA